MPPALDEYLLRSYLDGNMDETSAEAFELYLFERPDLAEMVAADSALAIGLRSGAAASTGLFRSKISGVRVVGALAAASIVLAVGFGVGRLPTTRLTPALTSASLIYLDAVRGTSPQKIRIPIAGSVVLAIPIVEGTCEPNISLRQGSIERTSTAMPDRTGYAHLVLDAGSLTTGKTQLTVQCANDEVVTHAFDFIR